MGTYQPAELWSFLPWGYLFTIALETPVLLVGLSAAHPLSRRLIAGVWLTACTYPIVVLVMPLLIAEAYGQIAFLAVAETFAPAAECLLFWLAFRDLPSAESPAPSPHPPAPSWPRDFAAITLANLTSFLVGIALLR